MVPRATWCHSGRRALAATCEGGEAAATRGGRSACVPASLVDLGVETAATEGGISA